jgi:hypothetical protein
VVMELSKVSYGWHGLPELHSRYEVCYDAEHGDLYMVVAGGEWQYSWEGRGQK